MSAPPGLHAFARRAGQLAGRHLWVLGAAGCVWLMIRNLEFSPPDKVRIDEQGVSSIVGEAQAQEFAGDLQNPQAVQVRASLRQFSSAERAQSVSALKIESDQAGNSRLLSQPVVTTILGMSANIDQTIRLQGGDLVVSLHVEATPRVMLPAKKGKSPRPAVISLEHRVEVQSTRAQSWGRDDLQIVELQSQGTLVGLDHAPHRIAFEVDGQLFALDLELNAQG